MASAPNSVATVSLTGFGELEQALKTIGRQAARKVGTKAMKASAQPIIDTAKVLVPVDTGVLEDSITYVPTRTREEQELAGQIGFTKNASYRAGFVEYGTAKMAAQPFMRPAIDQKGDDAIAIMGEVIWQGIETEANKAEKGKS